METSISLKTKAQDNTTATTTLSYVNPNASNENLKLYAQKIASLTSDEYMGATKVDKTNLDNEEPAVQKLPRNMHLEYEHATIQPALSNANKGQIIDVVYSGGGAPVFTIDENADFTFGAYFITGTDTPVAFTPIGWSVGGMDDPFLANGHVTISVAESDTYEAGEIIVTITGGEG